MFDYLQQFNNLPQELRDKVSTPAAMSALADLEKKYRIDLAMSVMKVMIKSASVRNLPAYFASEFNLSQAEAENLAKELSASVFAGVGDYLGLGNQMKAIDLDADINLIISEAGLVFPSADLVFRFKNILSTYLKGIRSKIAARDAFAKPVALGGLDLSSPEIDKIFKACDNKNFKSLNIVPASRQPSSPSSRLDKIIASADKAVNSEYDLKQALASGQIKRPEMPKSAAVPETPKPAAAHVAGIDTKHELPIPAEELSLPAAVPAASLPSVKPVVPSVVPTPNIKPAASSVSPTPNIKPAAAPITPIPKAKPAAAPVAIPSEPIRKPIAASRPAAAPSSAKKIMHDIKPMPKVMGPLEELQFLDLLNFRRLGKTPAEITAKIFSKIKLLEAEGYDKMVAGVRAWRQSPANRLYLDMVKEAINKGMTIKEFASSAQKSGRDYFSWEEIEAILAMNSRLVF